ncbi:PREDICTED: probable G-protein coupled receptor 152 [Condylura cristata]|uniref:probable G-protein coupled receptor 152 n=1 Tax=Condylura cristata TaxID=143302 RepID=UPI0003343D13|nr:PREDICTED: probable G-protein coupled receptor 152 [Condylura cristata]
MDTALEASLGATGHRPRTEPDDEDYYPQGGWDVVFLVALLILGLPANGLMAWLAGSQARQGAGTRLALLLLSLALSDFLFLAAAAFQILEIQHGGHWPLGTAACRFYYFLWGVSYSSGLFLLAALSLDRCLLALCPGWYPGRRPVRLPLWVCAGVWVLATLFSGPWLVFPEAAVWWYDVAICLDFWDSEELPLRMFEILGGLLPFLLLLVCHVLTQAAACKACRCGRPEPPACRGFARVAKAVLSAYVVLRLPYHVAQLLYLAFLWDVYPGYLLWEALVYSDYLILLNSCLSPFLCLLASADLRALLRAVLSSFAAALCEERPGGVTPAEPQNRADSGGQTLPGLVVEAQPQANPTAQSQVTPTAQPEVTPTTQANPSPQPQVNPTTQLEVKPTGQPQEPTSIPPQETPTAQPQETPNTLTAQPQETPNAQPQETPNTQPQETLTAQPQMDSGAQLDSVAQPQASPEAQTPEPTASTHDEAPGSPITDPTPEASENPAAAAAADRESPQSGLPEEAAGTGPT